MRRLPFTRMSLPTPWRPPSGAAAFESGQAWVFEVERPGDPARYALKRLKNPSRRERFEREIVAMKALRDDGIDVLPPVIQSGISEGRPYFVMPWYRAGSLQRAIESNVFKGRRTDGIGLLIRIARGIEQIHSAGWAHRDIKPANVLLDADAPRLSDFGLALSWLAAEAESRLTESAEAVGSRLYLAPENESGFNPAVDQRPADFTRSASCCGRYSWGETRQLAKRRSTPTSI